jgi:3',5'-cyclic AMP phosphodiesterase CpdA
MTLLLQVSDPHFGTETPVALAALRQLGRELRPDLLLVTGDITQRARPAQFAAARRCFDELGAAARLVVPGNHDIPLYDLLTRVFAPYRRYARAFGPARDAEFEHGDLLVIALNTTRRHRHKHGEVSSAQIERVARRVAAARPEQLRLVAVHQPVAVPDATDRSNLLRGHEAAIRRWSEVGVDAVLGGHIHLPYVLPLRARWPELPHPMHAVQAGTAVSSRVRGGIPNSVNVMRCGPGRQAVVERWDLDDAAGRFRPVASTPLHGAILQA